MWAKPSKKLYDGKGSQMCLECWKSQTFCILNSGEAALSAPYAPSTGAESNSADETEPKPTHTVTEGLGPWGTSTESRLFKT